MSKITSISTGHLQDEVTGNYKAEGPELVNLQDHEGVQLIVEESQEAINLKKQAA
jgi:hypothetical protein